MAAADKLVDEARQPAVQDTSLFADAEVLIQALRVQPPQRGHPRSAHEDDRSANEHEGTATGSAPRTRANHANDADSHSGIGTFSRAASHAGSRTARSNAAGRDHCSRAKSAECRYTSGKVSTSRKRRVARRTGDRPIDEELRNKFVQAVNNRFASH